MKFEKRTKILINKMIKSITLSASILVGTIMVGTTAFADIDYSFVVTSDPQFPWTAKTDDGIYQSDSDLRAESAALILNQYDSINDYSTSIGNKVIHTYVNGDVTAYGQGSQWSRMDQLFSRLKMPYSYGLGNHDIENNFEDTFLNQAWRITFNRMHTYRPHNWISKDTWKEDYFFESKHVGSLNYSQKIADFRMITANNYPTMHLSCSEGPGPTYWLTPGMDYIERQLEEARSANQPAILYIHKPNDWKLGSDPQGRFKAMVEKYYDNGTLRAVFAGHYHKTIGKVSYPQYFGKVPVYSSGSASQKTYLTAEVDHSKNEMKIYRVIGNVWEKKQLIDTIAINSKGLTAVNDDRDYQQQKELANRVGNSYHIINSLNNSRALDDSASSDDVIYFNEHRNTNQQWRFVFYEANNSFVIHNRANNFSMYESDSKWNGFSIVRTGVLNASDKRAQWRVVSAGNAYGTIPLYKFRNVRSGKLLTLNSYSGKLTDAAIGATLLTAPDFGVTVLQQFMLD